MILNKIKNDLNNCEDIIYKEHIINNNIITLIYSEVLTNSETINNFILKSFTYIIENNINFNDCYNYFYNLLPGHNIKKIDDYNLIIESILNGYSIFLYNNKVLAIETKLNIDRGVNDAKTEIAIRGSKESFNENYNTNLGLIKKRIKSKNLKTKSLNLGSLTLTKTSILYIENITDMNLVNTIYNKLKLINIDGIIDSGYIKNILTESNNLFPTIMVTERPDLVSMSLLEGKISIILENSPYALIMPTFFIDYFHTPDDYYQKNINVSFIRIIRLIAFFISIFLPGYYIAVTTHNQDSLSLTMLLNLISQRKQVPFSSITEALIMSTSFEILKESDIRASSTIASAVSILGGLVLGDALVSAGIISPIMIIVVAISAISSLVFTSIELSSSIRIFRFIIITLGYLLGIYGLILGLIYLIIKLSSLNNFNYPYTSPISPFIFKEIKDSFIKNNNKIKTRNPILTKNIIRGK